MMSEIILKAKARDPKENKLESLREKGFVPAVIYGPKTKNQTLYLEKDQINNVIHESEKAQITPIIIDEEKAPRQVIIQDLQFDKLTDQLLHIDFYEVDMKSEIETEVPLTFEGTAPAVKDLGGIFLRNVEEVMVKCLPANLPEEIKVNISGLKTFEDIIHIKDLNIPPGVEVLANVDDPVAMVTEPRSEKEMEALEEEVKEDVTGVEGVEDKKEEEEGGKEEGKEESGDKGDKKEESDAEKK